MYTNLYIFTPGKYYSLVKIYIYQPKLRATFVLPKNIGTMNCKPQNCFASVTITPPPQYPPVGLSTEVVYKA